MRLARMHGRQPLTRLSLHADPAWRKAVDTVLASHDSPWLEMDV